MKKKRYSIVVEIWGLTVEETEHFSNGYGKGFFKFLYSIRVNNGKKKTGAINNSWSSQTKKKITRVLKNRYASRLVVESYY